VGRAILFAGDLVRADEPFDCDLFGVIFIGRTQIPDLRSQISDLKSAISNPGLPDLSEPESQSHPDQEFLANEKMYLLDQVNQAHRIPIH
jgi:hypothetical protein